MPDVFEVTIVPGRRTASTRSSSARLTSSCSTTASMIQSTSAIFARSSKPAVVISADRVGREERVRLERAGAVEALARELRREVEQQRRHAGVGEMRGDLRAHRAGAEDGGGADHRGHPRVIARARAVDEEIDDGVGVGLE